MDNEIALVLTDLEFITLYEAFQAIPIHQLMNITEGNTTWCNSNHTLQMLDKKLEYILLKLTEKG